MFNKYRKSFAVFFYLLAIAGLFLIIYHLQFRVENEAANEVEPLSFDKIAEIEESNIVDGVPVEEKKPEVVLPSRFLLEVPFQSQAPYGDWSQPYQDGCEEASIVMVGRYFGNRSLTKEEMKSEIDSSVDWQIKNWGGHFDLDAEETLKLAKEYFNLSGGVVRNYDLDILKKYISEGTPIIAPTAGRMLENPNFTGEGPEYHMLVIVGYNDNQGVFIVNDPGTRKGESYIYKYQTVLNAISGPGIDMEKSVIVLEK
jgi:hypothetical protein